MKYVVFCLFTLLSSLAFAQIDFLHVPATPTPVPTIDYTKRIQNHINKSIKSNVTDPHVVQTEAEEKKFKDCIAKLHRLNLDNLAQAYSECQKLERLLKAKQANGKVQQQEAHAVLKPFKLVKVKPQAQNSTNLPPQFSSTHTFIADVSNVVIHLNLKEDLKDKKVENEHEQLWLDLIGTISEFSPKQPNSVNCPYTVTASTDEPVKLGSNDAFVTPEEFIFLAEGDYFTEVKQFKWESEEELVYLYRVDKNELELDAEKTSDTKTEKWLLVSYNKKEKRYSIGNYQIEKNLKEEKRSHFSYGTLDTEEIDLMVTSLSIPSELGTNFNTSLGKNRGTKLFIGQGLDIDGVNLTSNIQIKKDFSAEANLNYTIDKDGLSPSTQFRARLYQVQAFYEKDLDGGDKGEFGLNYNSQNNTFGFTTDFGGKTRAEYSRTILKSKGRFSASTDFSKSHNVSLIILLQ